MPGAPSEVDRDEQRRNETVVYPGYEQCADQRGQKHREKAVTLLILGALEVVCQIDSTDARQSQRGPGDLWRALIVWMIRLR